MSSLVCKPKIKYKKVRTNKPIQAEVVTFYNIVRKVAIASKCLEEEGFQKKNIARNHGNIDIILILEKPSISLLPSNHRIGKRARAFFR